MNDDEMLALAKSVLDQHFGLRSSDPSYVAECATCKGQPWPCPPSRLARSVQEQVLAR